MAIRLTEDEVHQACAEIAKQGEQPTSLNLLDRLGRGSLTTITKYLKSWKTSDIAQAMDAEALPVIVTLPRELSKEGEDLLKKMWSIAKQITDSELDIQREALNQAETENLAKVEEAFKFSEAQTLKIEQIEDELCGLKKQLSTEIDSHKMAGDALIKAGRINIGLEKDNDQLKKETEDMKIQISMLKKESTQAIKSTNDAEKQIAKLEGKLEVYQSLDTE